MKKIESRWQRELKKRLEKDIVILIEPKGCYVLFVLAKTVLGTALDHKKEFAIKNFEAKIDIVD